MKYTVHGLQQDKLIEMGLDNDDALILAVIKEMYSSKKMEYQIIDGERFIWINQMSLLNYIPIVGSESNLRRKIKKLEEKKIIEKKILNVQNGVKGTYSYINVTELLDYLSEYNTPCQIDKGRGSQNDKEGLSFCQDKDSSTILSNNINISKDILCSTDVQRIIDEWNSIGLQKVISIKAGTNRYKSLKARINEYGIDKVLKAIKNINESSFLKGQNKNNWTIYFDWLVKPNNFIKVLEGNYADEKGVNGNDFCSTRQDFSRYGKKESKYDYNKITGI
ncbi:hypothetical protein LI064_02330 [Clostridium perfringens]|uniref:hypothetical protein n=1 Tax=Clostridium perfringens TaxID=1502 RepID=UPI002246725A|nr:hypothetical protein [Clostridium perfringens]MCX0353359.1 hypothetical protein [Clostridium perfringens]